jgi:Spy/CpxP family protein refolding chaperone
MKATKLFLALAIAAAVCATSTFANEGDKPACPDKQEHKCCADAKAAGKTCEKCAPKDAPKDAPKEAPKH